MQNPATKIGPVRRLVYHRSQRRLEAELEDRSLLAVEGVEPRRVEAARPFRAESVRRLVDSFGQWKLVDAASSTSRRGRR